jgi:hypothetical protein
VGLWWIAIGLGALVAIPVALVLLFFASVALYQPLQRLIEEKGRALEAGQRPSVLALAFSTRADVSRPFYTKRSVLRGLLTVVSLPIAFLCGLYASAFISLFGTEEP